MWKLYCLTGDLDTDVVKADSNVGRVDESSVGSGDTVGGGLGDGGHGDGVLGGDLGDGVGVGQGSVVVDAGGQSVGVDESRVSLGLGISGPLGIDGVSGIVSGRGD